VGGSRCGLRIRAPCRFALPAGIPANEDELIAPAREGALRVLRASRDAGVKRVVVLTSSFAAIGYGHKAQQAPFDETSWTDLTGDNLRPYVKSKTLPERADFMSLLEMARVLRARMGAAASRAPTRQLPNWLVRLAALRDATVRQIVPELGKSKNATNEKARRVVGWSPRSNEDATVATTESLVHLGLLRRRPQVSRRAPAGPVRNRPAN
jgi:nucleoside-diphosphate-sugar epimerase